jgi:hypothetical protein
MLVFIWKFFVWKDTSFVISGKTIKIACHPSFEWNNWSHATCIDKEKTMWHLKTLPLESLLQRF